MQHQEQQQQLALATSTSGLVVLNVLCVASAADESTRGLASAPPSHAAPRQRSCANHGRTCVPCNQHRLQWPDGRPCIGNSRLTTGDSMVRRQQLHYYGDATEPVGPGSPPCTLHGNYFRRLGLGISNIFFYSQ